jgi:hypothetical protein
MDLLQGIHMYQCCHPSTCSAASQTSHTSLLLYCSVQANALMFLLRGISWWLELATSQPARQPGSQ